MNEYKCYIKFYTYGDEYVYSRPVNIQITKCFKDENTIRLLFSHIKHKSLKFQFPTQNTDDIFISLKINNEEIQLKSKSDFRLNKLPKKKKGDYRCNWNYSNDEKEFTIKALYVENNNEYTQDIYTLLEPFAIQKL